MKDYPNRMREQARRTEAEIADGTYAAGPPDDLARFADRLASLREQTDPDESGRRDRLEIDEAELEDPRQAARLGAELLLEALPGLGYPTCEDLGALTVGRSGGGGFGPTSQTETDCVMSGGRGAPGAPHWRFAQ